MSKNIVVCCDGTGNQFGEQNSNVLKLYSTLLIRPGVQTAYYHPGVGTMGARNALSTVGKWWTIVRGLAFGYGLSDNIADAYQFLMNEFENGDRIYLFGFSRGAYTARALGGLLHMFGLLRPGNEGLIPYALRLFKRGKKDKFDLARGFKIIFSPAMRAAFPGSLGHGELGGLGARPHRIEPGALPYTSQFPDVPIVRHAVSVDERRAFFRQNLIHPPPLPADQDLKQVWFAGVHSDVGGSYPEFESGLAKITLRWMFIEAAKAGLQLDEKKVNDLLGADPHFAAPSPTAQIHNSLTFWWWLGEIWPKRTKVPVFVPGEDKPEYNATIRVNLGRKRFMADGAHIHEAVAERMRLDSNYRPANLPREYVVEKDDYN